MCVVYSVITYSYIDESSNQAHVKYYKSAEPAFLDQVTILIAFMRIIAIALDDSMYVYCMKNH